MHYDQYGPPVQQQSGNSALKIIAIVVSAVIGLSCLVCTVGAVWLGTGPEGGVRLANEMEEYALQIIEEEQLLRPGEEIRAYYDTTIMLRGDDAYLLTDQRVIHHRNGQNAYFLLNEVEDIHVSDEGLIGTMITLHNVDGRSMKLEIAPLNGADVFVNALQRTWEQRR